MPLALPLQALHVIQIEPPAPPAAYNLEGPPFAEIVPSTRALAASMRITPPPDPPQYSSGGLP